MARLKWPGRSGPSLASVRVFTDGAIRPTVGRSGLGVIVQDEGGRIVACLARRAGAMTCNEAEYEAILFALEQLRGWRPARIMIFSDSRVVVEQAQGLAGARSPGLQQRLVRLRVALHGLPPVVFQHIRRERNRLADALANDVVDGYLAESLSKHG